MATSIKTTEHAVPGVNGLPTVSTLQAGDHLTREEFERRYEAMPDLKKAELIDGVVYMASPVIHQQHGQPHFDLITWLGCYRMSTPGTEGGDNSSLKLDLKNEPQPDGCLFIRPERGGQVQFDAKGYIVGAPELIAEVSASSASYDLHVKMKSYQAHRVREYVVWRVLENKIDWFVLEGEQFVALPCGDGIYRSRIFPGLWLDTAALMDGQLLKVFQTLQQGIASVEHQRFVETWHQPS